MKINKSGQMTYVVRFSILILSFSFILAGVLKQEHLEVLQKAVKICLECIGIG